MDWNAILNQAEPVGGGLLGALLFAGTKWLRDRATSRQRAKNEELALEIVSGMANYFKRVSPKHEEDAVTYVTNLLNK